MPTEQITRDSQCACSLRWTVSTVYEQQTNAAGEIARTSVVAKELRKTEVCVGARIAPR
jgi:hypothetical protein